jgi:cellulose synthase/poly-beta-1,6-N-acetylglucosamine synthase-like glycosyltransferase
MLGITGAGTNILLQTLVIILACYGFIVALGGLWHRLQDGGRGYKPFVSILLITNNDEGSIEGIVRWLLQLNYHDRAGAPRYEVLVVDDGSRDQTFAILERLAREYPSLQVRQAQEGESAYERGLALCNGDVICLLDLKKRPRSSSSSVGQIVTGLFGC